MWKVAAQLASQLGAVAGALIAGLSERISSVETIAPGVMTDVGIGGVVIAVVSGIVLVWIAVSEGRAAVSPARRISRRRQLRSTLDSTVSNASSFGDPFGDDAEFEEVGDLERNPELDTAFIALVEALNELPEEKRGRILGLANRLYRMSMPAVDMSVGPMLHLYSGPQALGGFGGEQEAVGNSHGKLGRFMGAFLTTMFVPFTAGRR